MYGRAGERRAARTADGVGAPAGGPRPAGRPERARRARRTANPSMAGCARSSMPSFQSRAPLRLRRLMDRLRRPAGTHCRSDQRQASPHVGATARIRRARSSPIGTSERQFSSPIISPMPPAARAEDAVQVDAVSQVTARPAGVVGRQRVVWEVGSTMRSVVIHSPNRALPPCVAGGWVRRSCHARDGLRPLGRRALGALRQNCGERGRLAWRAWVRELVSPRAAREPPCVRIVR